MRILHYIPSLDQARGGPVRAVLDLSAALARLGHHVTVCTTELPLGGVREEVPTQSVVHIPGPLVNAGPLERVRVRQCTALIAQHDLLHVHGAWNYANVQLARDARRMGKPYIVSPRGMLDDWSMEQKRLKKRLYMLLVGRKLLEGAAAVHCTAEGELRQSRKWFPKGNGVVLPNFLDLNPFRAAPGPGDALARFPALAGQRARVLFLSRLHYKKGADIFVEAAALATRAGVNATWVLAGSGEPDYERRVRDLVAARGLLDRVVFTGQVGGQLKVSLYQACEVFALPTSQENFGFVFPESLACGTPVVTTTGVDIWPELEASGGASIVDRTPLAFANAISAILASPSRRAAMGAAGKRWVFERFDEGHLIGQFEAMYTTCVNGTSR